MQYLLLIHDDPSQWAALSDDARDAMMAEYGTYTTAIQTEGILRDGNPLGRDAKLVRVRSGSTEVSDGPYAETREQLGGYYLVECDTAEQAAAAAARIPSARFGTIEVRPIAAM